MNINFKINKFAKLLYTFVCIALLECGPLGPNYRYGEIESFDNTYIRFRLPDLGPESKYFPPGVFVSENDKRTYYITIFFEEFEWLPNQNLQPEGQYWKKFYQNFNSLPPIIRSDPRFNVLPNCEYFLPVPSGKHRYKITTFNRNHAPVGAGQVSKMIDLPANFSLRIHLRNPKDLSEERVDADKYVNYGKGDEILFSIEPTPTHMDVIPCDYK